MNGPRFSLLALATLAACGGGEPTPTSAPPAPPASAAADAEAASAPWFEECARERGLDFVHHSGHRERFLYPELMGGGAALFDKDGDGDLDLFLVQSGDLLDDGPTSHRLYENESGHFRDVSAASGVSVPGYGMGVATGDYDGDGDVDLYITNVGPNRLLRNDGRGHFEDVSEFAGVGDPGWGTSACFLDLDLDGDLDLFVANYIEWSVETEMECSNPTGQADYCGPAGYSAPARDTLYRNEGGGRFRDVTVELGLGEARGNGLGVVPGDFDGDGRLDLFVANDLSPDRLWMHVEGQAQLVDRAELRGCARDRYGNNRAGMGVDAADVDGDDDIDLLVVHMARERDGFFRNFGEHFVEETSRVGIGNGTFGRTRFGVGFQDFDADGLLDLFFANGRVNLLMLPLSAQDPYAEPETLMRGGADGRWELVDALCAEAPIATGRGAAFGDIDGDGGVDVVVVNRDSRVLLYHNVVAPRGHWLSLRLVDGGRDALGASASLRLGERGLRRECKPSGSYCSASDARLHFGLGASSAALPVTVRWLDGGREVFGPLEPDRVHALSRGEGRAVE